MTSRITRRLLATSERTKRIFDVAQDRLDHAAETLREAANRLHDSNALLRKHKARK
jgi:hypothetical protein